MTWTLTVARDAERNLKRLPSRDRARICAALGQMQEDPFAGDVVQLRVQPAGYRRRIGSYRVLFDVDPQNRHVAVQHIVRRTSTTYR